LVNTVTEVQWYILLLSALVGMSLRM